jgi:hypothetical protein
VNAPVADWLLVHACSLLVFPLLIDALPRDTTVGVPTVIVIGTLVAVAGGAWVARSARGCSLRKEALAFVLSALVTVLLIDGMGRLLGAVYLEYLRSVAPLAAGLLVVPVAARVCTRRVPVELSRDPRSVRIGLVVQGVGVAMFLARYPLYAWTQMRELVQLAQVEFILLYPGLIYLRAALETLRRRPFG